MWLRMGTGCNLTILYLVHYVYNSETWLKKVGRHTQTKHFSTLSGKAWQLDMLHEMEWKLPSCIVSICGNMMRLIGVFCCCLGANISSPLSKQRHWNVMHKITSGLIPHDIVNAWHDGKFVWWAELSSCNSIWECLWDMTRVCRDV